MQTKEVERHTTRRPDAKVVVLLIVLTTASVCDLIFADCRFDSVGIEQVASSPLPLPLLLAIRVMFFFVILVVLVTELTSKDSVIITPPIWEGSRLEGASINMLGSIKLIAFTVQCWALQLVYFFGASCCSLLHLFEVPVSHAVSNALGTLLWLSYETSFACALLTTICVTFVLVPDHAKRGIDPAPAFFRQGPLIMHNANIVFMATELLFNELPFQVSHFPVSILWGAYYVLIAWIVLRTKGAVLYPFIDPTLPRAVLLHLALVSALAIFFVLGFLVSTAASVVPLVLRSVLIYVGCVAIMRTRWIRGIPLMKPPDEYP